MYRPTPGSFMRETPLAGTRPPCCSSSCLAVSRSRRARSAMPSNLISSLSCASSATASAPGEGYRAMKASYRDATLALSVLRSIISAISVWYAVRLPFRQLNRRLPRRYHSSSLRWKVSLFASGISHINPTLAQRASAAKGARACHQARKTAHGLMGCGPRAACTTGGADLQAEYKFGDGLGHQWAHGVGDLLLFVRQPAAAAVGAAREPEPIREGLEAARFPEGQPAVLVRMYEHALPIVSNSDGRLVPHQPPVDIAVGSLDVRIVAKHVRDILPVPALGDAPVPLDDV